MEGGLRGSGGMPWPSTVVTLDKAWPGRGQTAFPLLPTHLLATEQNRTGYNLPHVEISWELEVQGYLPLSDH